MRYLPFFILCIVAQLQGYAQNQKLIDSLELAVAKNSNDTNHVEALNALAFEYRNYNEAKAYQLLNRSLKLSVILKYPAGAALAYNHLGILNKNAKNFEEALSYHQMALAIRKQLADEQGIASSYNNLGVTYTAKGDDNNAMKYYLSSLRIREKMHDTAGMSAAYNNISRVYSRKSNRKLAKEFNLKALELRVATGDSFMVATYCALQGFYHYEVNEYTEALNYFGRALNIYKSVGDDVETALLMNHIGNILVENNKIDEGIKNHFAALKIQQANDDTTGIYTSTLSLAQAYTYKGDYSRALEYSNMAYPLLDRKRSDVKMFMDYYEVTAALYKKKGDPGKAIEAFTEYSRFKDSLISINNTAAVTEMQVKYETEKKDLEISNKNLALNQASFELQKRKAIAIGLVMLIILVVAVGYLSYSRYKLKKQRELDNEIIKQQELRSKAIIEAEERERTRIAKDLHDGIGQQLSAIKMKMSLMKSMDKEEYETQQGALIEMVDDAVKEVRGISHDMMPNALLRLGLAAATREFIDKIAGIGLLKIDLQIIGLNSRLDNTVETILYRVLQESVSNIIKHANATAISIQLIKDEHEISLVLEDNGKGFDTNKIDNFSGIGLKNIISRIEYLNGTVNFDSTPGAGTTVIVEVPLV